MSENILNQAIALAKAGQKIEARNLLKSLIETDQQNIIAWLWYADTWPDDQRKLMALELGSKHNPNNPKIQRALDVLRSRQETPAPQTSTISPNPPTFTAQDQTVITKKCPYCAMEIEETATTCRHCGRDLTVDRLPEDNANIFSKIMQEVRGPHGPRYLIGGGALITIFGCVGIIIAGGILPGAEKGTAGYNLAGFLSLMTALMLCGGVAIAIAGGAIGLLRNRKAKMETEGPAAVMPASAPPPPVHIQTKTNLSQQLPPQPTSPEYRPVQSSSPQPAPIQYQPVQTAHAQPSPSRGLSIEQRREILQREINKYIRQDYRVISQTDTTAQLVRPKRFSCLWFLIWAFLLIGWIFYLAWYLTKRDEQIYIEVDINGRVRTRR